MAAAAAATPERPGGRPKAMPTDERRALLVAAAEAVFLERGYADAGMAEVALRAGMSKRTLYALFASKAALFAEVANAAFLPDVPVEVPDGEPVAALTGYLCGFAASMLSDRRIGLLRIVIADSGKAPEVTEAFFAGSMRLGPKVISDWLALRRDAGEIEVEDCLDAALMLFGMAVGHPHMMRLMRQPYDAGPDLRIRVERAVRIFLAGCAVTRPEA